MTLAKAFLIIALTSCLLFASESHAENQSAAAQMFSNLTFAVERGDYHSFVLEGDDNLRRGITPAIFQDLERGLRRRMSRGSESRYLGHFEQHGCDVFLWTVTFKDGGDQLLAKLSVKDGKATAFSIQ